MSKFFLKHVTNFLYDIFAICIKNSPFLCQFFRLYLLLINLSVVSRFPNLQTVYFTHFLIYAFIIRYYITNVFISLICVFFVHVFPYIFYLILFLTSCI